MNVQGEHKKFLVLMENLLEMEITFFDEVENIGYSQTSWVTTRKKHSKYLKCHGMTLDLSIHHHYHLLDNFHAIPRLLITLDVWPFATYQDPVIDQIHQIVFGNFNRNNHNQELVFHQEDY